METVAVILAAGRGKRMVSSLPKVLHPIGGKPMLAHVLESVQNLCQKVIVVQGYQAEQIQLALQDYQYEQVIQTEQLGTGHAVQQVLPQLHSQQRVLILCGDLPLLRSETLQKLLAHTPNDALGFVSATLDEPYGLGRVVRNTCGQVEAIIEERDATDIQRKITEINSGVYVVPVKDLKNYLAKIKASNQQKELYLTDIVSLAYAQQQKVITVAADAIETLGVNTKAQWMKVERCYQQRMAQRFAEQGLLIRDPMRFDVRGMLHFEEHVEIDVNVVFEGHNYLGTGVKIGPNCLLRNCHIGSDTVIEANSVLDQVVLGRACRIGPFARLRPGCELEDGVKVGNFVELKKSSIGKNSSMSHLAYIGDAEVGDNVNIGAGTITCNYDGAYKHNTRIGNDAFIGSNTSLIAPVAIGQQATIGAGSIISKDAPANKLTVARSTQQTINHWKRPEKTTTEENS